MGDILWPMRSGLSRDTRQGLEEGTRPGLELDYNGREGV